MKIAPNIQNSITNYRRNQNSAQSPVNYSNHSVAKDSVSFGGLKGGVTKLFDKIGANFFIEFLVIDSISMMIPRTLIGLGRDKEKTGKINYKAGAEEAGREVVSGPSMNLIPMGVLLFMKHKFPASHMETPVLDSMNHNMQEAINNQKDLSAFASQEKMDKALANQIFDDAFADLKLDDREGLKSKFSELLLDSKTSKPSLVFQNKAYVSKLAAFQEHVAKIQNMNQLGAPDQTQIIKLSNKPAELGKDVEKMAVKTDEIFASFHNYSKDIVNKFTKQDFAQKTAETIKNEAVDFLKEKKKLCANAKLLTAITGFLAVGAFLLYLPKLYQQGGLSPAMESAKRAQQEAANGGANENK